MKPDPILEEIWRIKDALAAQHNYDVRALAAALRKEQAAGDRKVVSPPDRSPAPNE